MNQRYLVFDSETTGLDFVNDHLISLGWILYDNGEILKHVEYISNDMSFKNNAESINHITEEMRHNGHDLQYILERFHNDISNENVYAFNIEFDMKFITKYYSKMFDEVNSINEISTHKYESVLNAIQRITKSVFNSFDYSVKLNRQLHNAYDDVTVELVILLHDHYNEDVTKFFIKKHHTPLMPFGKYKNKPISEVDPDYMEWFKTICKQHERYILEEYE